MPCCTADNKDPPAPPFAPPTTPTPMLPSPPPAARTRVLETKQFCLLVLSNLAVVPAVRLALRLGAATGAAPAVVLGLNGAASALYHMCDLEVSSLLLVHGGVLYHSRGWLFSGKRGRHGIRQFCCFCCFAGALGGEEGLRFLQGCMPFV